MKIQLTWKETFKWWNRDWSKSTIIGQMFGRPAVFLFWCFSVSVCAVVWTAITIFCFCMLSLFRIFQRFDYLDHVSALCLWWFEKLAQGTDIEYKDVYQRSRYESIIGRTGEPNGSSTTQ